MTIFLLFNNFGVEGQPEYATVCYTPQFHQKRINFEFTVLIVFWRGKLSQH